MGSKKSHSRRTSRSRPMSSLAVTWEIGGDDNKELNAQVNEVAPEVSAVNKVNKVNDVNDVNKDSCVACNIKEEVSEGKPLEVMRRGSFAAKSEVRTSWEPGESGAAMFDEVKSEVNDNHLIPIWE